MDVSVNMWAVILATASSMVVGSVWYAKSVFGTAWAKLAKVNMDKRGGAAGAIIATLIVSFLTAYVLAHVSFLSHEHFHNSFLQDAVTTAFWVWLGFTAARIITHDAFEGRPVKLTALTCLHELVTLLVMGTIIGAMGV